MISGMPPVHCTQQTNRNQKVIKECFCLLKMPTFERENFTIALHFTYQHRVRCLYSIDEVCPVNAYSLACRRPLQLNRLVNFCAQKTKRIEYF